jgi:type III secretion protein L
VSRKFFSLIYGTPNKVIPNKKVIAAEDLGLLLSSQEVLETVYQDAEKYKLEIAQECEKLKERASQEGFAEGFQKWAEHIAKIEEEILQVRQDLQKMLIPVALKAAKKIVGREIELSEDTIVDIVSNSLKSVSQHKKITIYVNKKDLEHLENNRSRLKEIFESLEALSIRERNDVARGGCIIETEGGIINAQLENQWIALERAFTSLMKSKEEIRQPH